MEASTASSSTYQLSVGGRLQAFANKYGLFVVLLALPVFYGIKDLSSDGNLQHLAQNLFNGLSNGSILALIAVGYTLVYGIIELINFAHGDVFMIGSFVTAGLFGTIGLTLTTGTLGVVGGLLLTLFLAMAVCGALNVMIEKVAYRPLRSAPKLAPLITAVGMSFVLQNVGLLWLGGSPASVPDLIHAQQDVFTVLGVTVQRADILAFVVTIPLVVVMIGFIQRSRLGKAMRATAQD